jgi:hypothetical protein
MVGRGLVKTGLMALVALSLVSGVVGGLLRAGLDAGQESDAAWLARAALAHAALMVCGFLGTVIGIERAVAVKRPAAFLAPIASGLASVALLVGHDLAAARLFVVASLVFAAVNVLVVRRQQAAHTALLLVAALAWLIGNVLFTLGLPSTAVLPWWFAFLVMTIAAERLEMTRLMRRRPGAEASLHAVLVLMLAGAAACVVSAAVGGVVYGLSLVLLAAWCACFDIARRTVLAHGLSRYMAVCLLGGYAWLAVSGFAWAGMSLGFPLRDIALHGLGLGFIMSMVMGHAPVILPAVARVKLAFGPAFYLPLAMLHISLVLRLFVGAADWQWRAAGTALNAFALVWFVATVLVAALRHLHTSKASSPSGDHRNPHPHTAAPPT